MKEIPSLQQTSTSFSHHINKNNTNNNMTNGSNQRRYAMFSTEWISAIGEELGIHPLQDSLLKKLAEDASYRLREILHKCVTRLNHSQRKKLTCSDVNAVIGKLCDADPVYGVSDEMPSYHTEAQVFVPHDDIIDVSAKAVNPINFIQPCGPYLTETEMVDTKLIEIRHNYAKKALKTLFNGSHKTFQVLLNDCTTNPHLDGEGVIDTLISITRSTVISNNAQYTRVTMRTCQLIIAIASNSQAIYPCHLNSVEKLTELLLDLLLGQSFINPNVESLFRTCALKLMLRWPSVADKYVPTLESVLMKDEKDIFTTNKKRATAMELLGSIQPLIFFQTESGSPLSLCNILKYADSGTAFWYQIALAVYALIKSDQPVRNLNIVSEHFGDSLLPYILKARSKENKTISSIPIFLPIIVRSKIRYAEVHQNFKNTADWQSEFPDSVLRGPRREIRFAFAGGRPVAPNNLRRVSLRANYQILRSEHRATSAHIASRRLLILKDKKRNLTNAYNFTNVLL